MLGRLTEKYFRKLSISCYLAVPRFWHYGSTFCFAGPKTRLSVLLQPRCGRGGLPLPPEPRRSPPPRQDYISQRAAGGAAPAAPCPRPGEPEGEPRAGSGRGR